MSKRELIPIAAILLLLSSFLYSQDGSSNMNRRYYKISSTKDDFQNVPRVHKLGHVFKRISLSARGYNEISTEDLEIVANALTNRDYVDRVHDTLSSACEYFNSTPVQSLNLEYLATSLELAQEYEDQDRGAVFEKAFQQLSPTGKTFVASEIANLDGTNSVKSVRLNFRLLAEELPDNLIGFFQSRCQVIDQKYNDFKLNEDEGLIVPLNLRRGN